MKQGIIRAAHDLNSTLRSVQTIRAQYQSEFDALLQYIRAQVEQEAHRYGMTYSWDEVERFPATQNDPACVTTVRERAKAAGLNVQELAEPFRWSEDFGWYLQQIPGAMLGIGDGEQWPQLHTVEYEFNDAIIERVLSLFAIIVRK